MRIPSPRLYDEGDPRLQDEGSFLLVFKTRLLSPRPWRRGFCPFVPMTRGTLIFKMRVMSSSSSRRGFYLLVLKTRILSLRPYDEGGPSSSRRGFRVVPLNDESILALVIFDISGHFLMPTKPPSKFPGHRSRLGRVSGYFKPL